MKTTFEQLIEDHGKWADSTFPKGTSTGALLHAEREIKEVIEEIESCDPNGQTRMCTEYADVLFCIMDSARREGIAIRDILDAGERKLQINKSRSWKDNGDGSYSHIKS